MRALEYVFELILQLYPRDFRRQYGDEMRAFVRARLDEPRYASPEELMAALVHDARYAVRTLRRRPAFTIVSAITLALGIGATSAIFGVEASAARARRCLRERR